MIYETLLVERDGPLAALTLNRPDRLNAMNVTMVRELIAALNDVFGDDAVRGILLTGAGRGNSCRFEPALYESDMAKILNRAKFDYLGIWSSADKSTCDRFHF